MSPSLAFTLGILLGVLLMCCLALVYLLIKLFELVWWIYAGLDDEDGSN